MMFDVEAVVALMHELEAGAWRGAPVGVRELRRAAGVEKAWFDQVVLDGARMERLSLHRHDYPAGCSQGERDEMVTDGESFYVVVALRPCD